MTDLERSREELAKATSLVLTARRLLAGGTLVDLSEIEDWTRRFCLEIAGLGRKDGMALHDDVKALIARLDLLEQDIREHLDRLKRDDEG